MMGETDSVSGKSWHGDPDVEETSGDDVDETSRTEVLIVFDKIS